MNKKIMILIVIAECVLAVFLIGVIGLAIESTYSGVDCREVHFTTADGTRLTSEAVVEVSLLEMQDGYQLYYKLDPEDTSDVPVTFMTSKPEIVMVSETGLVRFREDTDVVITVSSKNGKTATITLVPKRNTHGTVDMD